jgi:hypothetical protein
MWRVNSGRGGQFLNEGAANEYRYEVCSEEIGKTRKESQKQN